MIGRFHNILSATKNLAAKIQEIIKDALYQAEGELYLLSNIRSEELELYRDLKINIDGYSNINLEQWLNLVGIENKDKISVIY